MPFGINPKAISAQWIGFFVNVEKRLYAREWPGVEIDKPCVPHAITLEDFREIESSKDDKNALNALICKLTKKYYGLHFMDMNLQNK